MRQVYFSFLLYMFTSFSNAYAASTMFTLYFFAKGSGQPLKRVEVRKGADLFYSDPTGKVDVEFGEGDYGKINVFRQGFLSQELDLAASKGQKRVDIYLLPKLDDQGQIVVKGKRGLAVSKKVISATEAQKIAPDGDPAQIVRLLPGVQTNSYGGEVVIRGSGPNDSRYFIDDLEVPGVFHDIGNLSVLPPALLEGVEFESGGFSSKHGDATGGIIVLKTKDTVPTQPRTEVVSNVPLYSGVYHERPLSKESFLAVSLRRSYLDYFINLVMKNSSDPNVAGLTLLPYFADAHMFYLEKTPEGQNKWMFLATDDGFKVIAPTDIAANENGTSEFSLRTTTYTLGMERRMNLSHGWTMRSTPQSSYKFFRRDLGPNRWNESVLQLRVPTEFSKRLEGKSSVYFGFDPSYSQTATRLSTNIGALGPGGGRDGSYEQGALQESKRKENRSKAAVWVSLQKQLGRLVLNPGLRAFYNAQLRRYGYDPRSLFELQLNPVHTVKFAFGQYSQQPEPFEASVDVGNPSLTFERSHHYISGLQSQWSDEWETEVQVFAKRSEALVVKHQKAKYANSGASRSQGAELFVRRNLTSRFFAWLAYTYSTTRELDPKTGAYYPSAYDQNSVLNLAASYRLSTFWELGNRYLFHTGNPYTPIKRAVYDGTSDSYSPRTDPSDTNGARLPAFNSTTAYLTRSVLYDTWTLDFKFGVESYWPKAQVLGVQNNYDYTKVEYQKGLPAIPFIEVKGVF